MDLKEFETMAPPLRDRIVAMVRKMSAESGADLADDVAQDTLMRLWTIRDRLGSYTSVEALAMVIARNRAIDLLKRASAGRTCQLGDIDVTDASPPPDQKLISSEDESRALSLIGSLPSVQQAVLKMRHIDGLEIADIAAILCTNTNAVRVALSRARHTIRKQFSEL